MLNQNNYARQNDKELFEECDTAERFRNEKPSVSLGPVRSALALLLDNLVSDSEISYVSSLESKIYSKILKLDERNEAPDYIIDALHTARMTCNKQFHRAQGAAGPTKAEASKAIDCLLEAVNWYNGRQYVSGQQSGFSNSMASQLQGVAEDVRQREEEQRIQREQERLQQEAIDRRIETERIRQQEAERRRQAELKAQQERAAAQERIARMEAVRKAEQERVAEQIRRQKEANYQLEIKSENQTKQKCDSEVLPKFNNIYDVSEQRRMYENQLRRRNNSVQNKPQYNFVQLDEFGYIKEINIHNSELHEKCENDIQSVECGTVSDAKIVLAHAKTYMLSGGLQNYRKALELFVKAADYLGEASYYVGFCYEHGFGISENLASALNWYRRAMRQGYNSRGSIDNIDKKIVHISSENYASYVINENISNDKSRLINEDYTFDYRYQKTSEYVEKQPVIRRILPVKKSRW